MKLPVLIEALKDDSPLVRASAASALEGHLSKESIRGLLAATADPVRLVRIRAAAALAPVPPEAIDNADERKSLRRAAADFKKAMTARPDDWASHANLGGYYLQSGDFAAAVEAFETALKLEPRMVSVMVTLSTAYANLNQNDKTEYWLRRAAEAGTGQRRGQLQPGVALGRFRPLRRGRKGIADGAQIRPAACPGGLQPGGDSGRKEGLCRSGRVLSQGP